jgi:hypothetical protein
MSSGPYFKPLGTLPSLDAINHRQESTNRAVIEAHTRFIEEQLFCEWFTVCIYILKNAHVVPKHKHTM